MPSSHTWTTSSGELGFLSDTDELNDRTWFIEEYNRLAKKHNVRLLVVSDFGRHTFVSVSSEKRSWLSRLLRSTSTHAASTPPLAPIINDQALRRRRSVSGFAQSLVGGSYPSTQELDLQAMVRISGKSVLYLPQDYTPGSLVLPTCIRATAQHLAQNPATGGMFRIPGSTKAVNALFEYYCRTEKGAEGVSGTVRCPTLPSHFATSVHDVASTFKRLLAVLPGGLMGSLSLFDALVATHSQLAGKQESPRTKQTKVRARMIALAIGTVESQFRRGLICAVLGLLSLVGRTAEEAPTEDDNGRPLPTSDLMGYNALGIIFGPLLLGDLLSQYKMNVATPASGLLLLPISPTKLQKAQKVRRKPFAGPRKEAPKTPVVDKIHIANDIAEMLISNWREIVRQMKAMGVHQSKPTSESKADADRPLISGPSATKRPHDSIFDRRDADGQVSRAISPELSKLAGINMHMPKPQSKKGLSSTGLPGKPLGSALSTMVEGEHVDDGEASSSSSLAQRTESAQLARSLPATPTHQTRKEHQSPFNRVQNEQSESGRCRQQLSGCGSPGIPMEAVPPRTSSRQLSPNDTPTKGPLDAPKESSDQTSSLNITDFLNPQAVSSDLPDQSETCSSELTKTASYEAPPDDLEAQGGLPAKALNLGQADKAASLPKTSILGPLPVNVRQTSDAPKDAETSLELPTTGSEHLLQANKYKSEMSQYSHSQTLKPVPRSSTSSPLGHLWNPIRTAIHSTGHNQVHTSEVTPGYRTAADGQAPRTQHMVPDISQTPHPWSYLMTRGDLALDHPVQIEVCGVESMDSRNIFSGRMDGTSSELSIGKEASIPKTSDAESKHSGVRAIAAKFEGANNDPQVFASQHEQDYWPKSLGAIGKHRPPIKSAHSTKAATMSEKNDSPSKHSSPSKSHTKMISRLPRMILSRQPGSTTSGGRFLVSDSVASRATAIKGAEANKQDHFIEKKPPPRCRSPQNLPGSQYHRHLIEPSQQHGFASLGTWMPHREEPPVAQHLNYTRPDSSACQHENQDSTDLSILSPVPRRGRTTSMHIQIRSLQRQLELKTEEMLSLRRQIEAHENSDVGTLSEQLRETARESRMWKERAETAERRIHVFERFANKLKSVREADVGE
ncbi:uncharacterized protein F5Z01DRAFT_624792 [Emericellopsis atlantica]|uniref:Rho-GAP domain-containing protein n=1 Tax=Emericellopsis atlantica TaxID=2614577 RepID=A0A9P7ZJ54_9HYPO|nr:uncharacterized protein F5Z01DRAFT_624792 [Emericellopsis atlantica]KAG9252881.1 hypothetical protein F5Z01DRAFT_624792 [Emericellopsis atlantica]